MSDIPRLYLSHLTLICCPTRKLLVLIRRWKTLALIIDAELRDYRYRDVEMSEDDIRKKNSFLYVIRYDTFIIKDKLVRLKDLIDKYNGDPKPEKWESVKEYSKSELKRLEEIRKYIQRHLGIILYLVKNHRLDPGKFDYVYIKFSVDLFYEAYYVEPEYDQPGLADLMSDIEDQIVQLYAALQFLDAEKAP
jgi:hypothetical protein